ncbi:MAG: hypothetical protein KBT63_01485 [Porticoccaceae bacterium]|nr:hypothetical protein [Porticoccaceae bacterium]
MLQLLFFIMLVVEIVLLLVYARKLNELAEYSKSSGTAIFGSHYNSVYKLYSDLGFLNNLFSGDKFDLIEDQTLRVKLTATRKLLLTQLILGAAIFVLVIISGAQV